MDVPGRIPMRSSWNANLRGEAPPGADASGGAACEKALFGDVAMAQGRCRSDGLTDEISGKLRAVYRHPIHVCTGMCLFNTDSESS